jgi:hypothetical protein
MEAPVGRGIAACIVSSVVARWVMHWVSRPVPGDRGPQSRSVSALIRVRSEAYTASEAIVEASEATRGEGLTGAPRMAA